MGSLGSVDVYGIPSTSYAIDGTVLANYTAPIIDPGFFQLNVTFFTSPTLTAGTHTLVITNLNGTAPNVFWLDYLAYSPSTITVTSGAQTTSTPATTGVATTTAAVPSGSGTTDSNPSTTSKSNAGAIAGGVVGGLAGLALLAALAWWWFLRRRRGSGARYSPPDGMSLVPMHPIPFSS